MYWVEYALLGGTTESAGARSALFSLAALPRIIRQTSLSPAAPLFLSDFNAKASHVER
jgi:hypothetical protein